MDSASVPAHTASQPKIGRGMGKQAKAKRWVEEHHGKEIHLGGVSGKNLRTDDGGNKISTTGAEGKWATWLVEKVDDKVVMFKNKGTGKYLRIRKGEEDANGGGGEWCHFEVRVRPDDHIIIKALKCNEFLGFDEHGSSKSEATKDKHCLLKVKKA